MSKLLNYFITESVTSGFMKVLVVLILYLIVTPSILPIAQSHLEGCPSSSCQGETTPFCGSDMDACFVRDFGLVCCGAPIYCVGSRICLHPSHTWYITPGECSPSGNGCAVGCSTSTITISTSSGAQVIDNGFLPVNTSTFLIPITITLSSCSSATRYQITAQYLDPATNNYVISYNSLWQAGLNANPALDFTNRWTRWRITGQSGTQAGMSGGLGELYFYPVKVIARILSFTQDSALINWEVGLPLGLTGNPNIYLNLGSTDTLIRSYTTPTFIDSDGLSQYQGTYLISGSGLNLKDNPYQWSLKMSLDGGTTKTVISSGKLPRVALFRVAFPTGPWIQTIGGDVHSNIRIHTPGGP